MILYSVDMCVPVRGHVRDRKKCCDILNRGVDISGGGKFRPDLWVCRLAVDMCVPVRGHVRACAWTCACLCVDMCVPMRGHVRGWNKTIFPDYQSGGQVR